MPRRNLIAPLIALGPTSIQDESTELTFLPYSLNFSGAGVTATNDDGDVTVSIPGGGSGESNTASNASTDVNALGVFYQESGVDFQFNGVRTIGALLNAVLNATTHTIEIRSDDFVADCSYAGLT